MKLQKTQIAVAVGAALLVGGTAVQAQDRFTVQVYGQVSRALMHVDDGTANKWFHVDNDSSGSRFGFTGTAQAMPGLRGGFRIEGGFQSNVSSAVAFTAATPPTINNAPAFAERHIDMWLEGAWGRMNMGQGDGAANGATESDLSGTGMANGVGVADLGGGFQWRNTATTPATLSGVTIGNTINQQDFESRYDRLMYTTPTFGGFRAQGSWGQNANADTKEVALWYAGKLAGDLTAAIGWSEQGAVAAGGTRDETMGGSISWLHTSGFNLTFSYSTREQPLTAAQVAASFALESTWTYLKAGWKFGAHAIAIDYATGEDFNAKGDESKVMGIGYVWNPIRWLELYAAYKIHSLDRPGSTNGATVTAATTLEDIQVTTVGTRIRF